MTQDEEGVHLQSLFAALGVVAEWEALTGGLVPSGAWNLEDGSDLAGDDRSTYPHELSLASWTAISAAVSHLGCLRDSLFVGANPGHVTARLHTYGQFTLVRGALENASRAVWLLESDDREVRLLRLLQQERQEARDMDKVREEAELPSGKRVEARFAELAALARRANVDPNAIKQKADYTTIVRAAADTLLPEAPPQSSSGRHVLPSPMET